MNVALSNYNSLESNPSQFAFPEHLDQDNADEKIIDKVKRKSSMFLNTPRPDLTEPLNPQSTVQESQE